MNIAVLLGAGKGTRLKNSNVPKQFIKIKGETVLEMTTDKFLISPVIDIVLVVVPENWKDLAEKILANKNNDKLRICCGGVSRQESLYKAIKYLCSNFDIKKNDKIISHDIARPFITLRIIKDNVEMLDRFDATDTVISATDTIVNSTNSITVSHIPLRSQMYQGQTPQSFYCLKFKEIYESLSCEYLEHVTDAAKILSDNGCTVGLVRGEIFNFKITTDFDLKVANCLIDEI